MSTLLLETIADTTTRRDREGVHCAIVQLLSDFLEADSVTIYRLVDEEGCVRLSSYAESPPPARVPASRGRAPRELPTLAEYPEWNDCVRQQHFVQYSPQDGTDIAVLPIMAERGVAALLVIRSRVRLRSREISHVSAILRILNNHLALLDYGELDTLTGMLNRKTYEASFERVRERLRSEDPTRDQHEATWLGMVDIDKFKGINDTYGHLFGDEVLLLVSQLMKQCFRGADRLFRFGGEEFVAVLEQATPEGAQIAFERLRSAIEAFAFPQVGRVTISLGYSQIQPTDSPTSCVERADAALYYAKHHGRNNVRCYEQLIADGELTAKDEDANVEMF